MITTGQNGEASDFINQSQANATPANDAGRVPKLESDGKVSQFFIRRSFGGNGSDGSLTVSSGNTNIDLGGERVVIKQYTSISITGTGSVTFTNPHANGTVIILKVQGNVTLTSSATPMLSAAGCGAAGGAAVSANSNGNAGSPGQTIGYIETKPGGGGITSNAGTGGTSGGTATTGFLFGGGVVSFSHLLAKWPRIFVGAGGGSGNAYSDGGSATSGAGGRGGGCLLIECAGAWNFTTANGISVAGIAGSNGEITGIESAAGGGGGGGGGLCIVIYNILTANTGSINVSAGTGGTGNATGVGDGAGGGAGGGSATNNGANGTNTNSGVATTGGTGGAGLSEVMQNTDFL